MKTNTTTVSITVTPDGKLETVIQSGFQVSILEDGTPSFRMKIRGYDVLWKDSKKLGIVEENRLVSAGFYLQKKNYVLKNGEYPFFLNIGKPFHSSYPNDREVLLQVGPKCKLYMFSADFIHEDVISQCVNFPKNSKDFKGEILLRIPDGSFLRIETEKFGIVCLLNVDGQITKHFGNFPNPNTKIKAVEAAFSRNIWVNIVLESSENKTVSSLENAFVA
jgi:hypothetical protein